ncbi:hypothetical protein AABB02_33430 [Streptomyces rimosus]|uniref:hypothetical protein n=1 Tax=Streptomyces rimosus TaxID=1927 RepID=UPI0031D04480
MSIPGNFLSVTTESIDPNTSGWAPRTNCTLGLGSGGRNGDGTLRLTASAAGEMQARTAAAYPVTPGEVYFTFADASGATVPERIGILWLAADGTELSVTWSMATATAATAWHRISVAGTAPATAAKAQVLLSSTPAAAGVIAYFENVYLGYPLTTAGNLFSFNTEAGGELSASGWFNEVNSSVTRQVPMVTWPVDSYRTGGHVIAMTAAAGGNASMRSTDRPAATGGTEYLAELYLNPPTASAVVWVELRFYDSGTQLAAKRAVLAQPGTGWYRQRISGRAPAATNQVSIAAGIDGATAGQVLRVEGAVVTVAPVLRAGTVVPYEDASCEQGTGGWQVVSGAAALARSTPWGAESFDGSYCLTLTSPTATTSVLRSARFSVSSSAGGQLFRTEAYAKVTAGGWTLTRAVRWYTAANADLGTTAGSTAAAPTPNWWQLANDFTAPATATQAALEYTLTATATSSSICLDRFALWKADASTTVTGHDATASVSLTLRELTAGQSVTVYRALPDGSRTLVRGPAGLLDRFPLPSDLLTVEDYEAPLGTALRYLVELRDGQGSLMSTRTSDTVMLTAGDPEYAWLKDPGAPLKNLRLLMAKPPEWKRPVDRTAYHVRGRRNPVILSDVRGGLEGDLFVYTRSDEEADALHWLLDSGGTLLWQVAPGVHERDLYVSVAEVELPRVFPRAGEEWRVWTLPLTQVDMPSGTAQEGGGTRTWQDVLSQNATWQTVLDRYATWEAVLFDRRTAA